MNEVTALRQKHAQQVQQSDHYRSQIESVKNENSRLRETIQNKEDKIKELEQYQNKVSAAFASLTSLGNL